jgi:hypothetical protein
LWNPGGRQVVRSRNPVLALRERLSRYLHDKRRYVKLTWIALAAALVAFAVASPARAELVFAGQVDGARLVATPAGGTSAVYVLGSKVVVATRTAEGWSSGAPLSFARPVELDGAAATASGIAVLVRARDGTSLVLWTGKRRIALHRDSRRGRFGPAGLAVDSQGRLAVGYPLWFPSHKTFLRLARVGSDGKVSVRGVTKEGFPSSRTLPAAAPVVLASGEVRVVETFLPAAIDWGLNGWGKLLFSSALGVPTGAVAAAASGSTVFAAWTVAYPTLGPPAVALAEHGVPVRTGIEIENAVLAALTVSPAGPELAANRCIPAAAFGLDGSGICGGIVAGAGVDGIVADYSASAAGRQLLVQMPDGLAWFASPGAPSIHVTLKSDLTGSVAGATGGAVTVYRERPGQSRTQLAAVPLASDGSFSVPAPASPVAAAYRAVYTDSATGIPYAALVGP